MLIEGFYGEDSTLVITDYDYVRFSKGRINITTKRGNALQSNYMSTQEALPMLEKLNEVQHAL